MDRADFAELGSRLPENVRALERRKNPMFVLTYRGIPVPYRDLRISASRVQPGAPVFYLDEYGVMCEAVVANSQRPSERVDNSCVPTVLNAEEHERLTGRKWPF